MIYNRNLFFIVLKAGKFKIKVPADLVSDNSSFSASKMASCRCIRHSRQMPGPPHKAEGIEGSGNSEVSLISNATNIRSGAFWGD